MANLEFPKYRSCRPRWQAKRWRAPAQFRVAVLWTSLLTAACGSDPQVGPFEVSASGFSGTAGAVADSGVMASGGASTTAGTTTSGGDTAADTNGSDGGEPPGPGEGEELCDAGNEAWAKRVVVTIQGRRPESIREIRLLVQMVEQLDGLGLDGRREVARGLATGSLYLQRWKQFLYEQLRVNVNSDRRNEDCYDVLGPGAQTADLAAHIRDNPPTEPFVGQFRMADVVYSSLLLDDVTPAYRADLFARNSAPLIAGNVTPTELEVMNRVNYGQSFEASYLGRRTDCLPCHRTEYARTDDVDPYYDRHWPIPGNFELAVYGPMAGDGNHDRPYAIFRHAGFAEAGTDHPWNMSYVCGSFDFSAPASTDLLDEVPYMVGGYADVLPASAGQGATVFHLDERVREGFADLYEQGLILESDGTIDDLGSAFAGLFSMNFANRVWREVMGTPLTVANGFPRNPAQQQTLQQLMQVFIDNHYSLRELLAEIASHPYFNQAPPDVCATSIPYHLPAIFDPFTKTSSDPLMRGNGIGDMVHRHTATVLLDSTMRTMWWDLPQRFGPAHDPNEIPGTNCGAGGFPACSEGPARVELLRDMGMFLNDSESGFNGVDFNGLLHWEQALGSGTDPDLQGTCTGPLSGGCSADDWITQLVALARADTSARVRDVAIAIKDRVLTEPRIANDAEVVAIQTVLQLDLDTVAADVAAGTLETAARRFVGFMFNTPQFLIEGVVSRDQPRGDDPVLVVQGTDTQTLCDVLGDWVLGDSHTWSCGSAGISITE